MDKEIEKQRRFAQLFSGNDNIIETIEQRCEDFAFGAMTFNTVSKDLASARVFLKKNDYSHAEQCILNASGLITNLSPTAHSELYVDFLRTKADFHESLFMVMKYRDDKIYQLDLAAQCYEDLKGMMPLEAHEKLKLINLRLQNVNFY